MSNVAEVVGSVVSLWRYPVKSMMGEELNAAELSDRGLVGDRQCALVDRSTGQGCQREESQEVADAATKSQLAASALAELRLVSARQRPSS